MMTTSTFSFAMSPPLGWHDVGLIGDAEGGVALHRPVHDVDGIAAQDGVDEARARSGPAFDLVLAHIVDEVALLRRRQRLEFAAGDLLAGAVDGADGGAIEI